MLRLLGLVLSIGLADSLNPSTIVPAMYLATGPRARTRTVQFTLGVFATYLGGGLLIALGPGQLLISLLPHPRPHDRHIIELAVGVALAVVSLLLWHYRVTLAQRDIPDMPERGRSSAVLGITITAVELPTAFPYFAAIAAIVGADLGPAREALLLLLFNVCFILPLVCISGILCFAGERANPWLHRRRVFLQQHWPQVLSALLLTAAVLIVLLGASGLAGHGRSRLGRFMSHLHGFLHP